MNEYITSGDEKILKLTSEIMKEFHNMEQTHPSDMKDMVDAIHCIQGIIAVRVARKSSPEYFVTYKQKEDK